MFHGVMPAIVTPMRPDGAFDPGAMTAQVARHLGHGAGGIFCGGTNGEFYALTRAELVAVARTCVEAAEGRPVMAGSSFGAIAETAELVRAYRDVGASAISVLVPYFVDCTQAAMADYFAAVADASSLPVVIYNIPGKTRNDLLPETVARIAGHENVIGIKDSSGSLEKLRALAALGGIQVMTGSDGLILDGLRLGLSGFVSGFANVAPEHVYGIVSAYRTGDEEGAGRHQEKVERLRGMLKLGNPPTVTKRAAALRGEAVGGSRLPCRVEVGEIDEALLRIMAEAGIEARPRAGR